MRTAHLSTGALLVSSLAVTASADEVKIVNVKDEGHPDHGRAAVEAYDGVLPAQREAGGGTVPQLSGFPVEMGTLDTFTPSRGLALEDITGDGKLEIVGSSTDSQVYVWDHTGQLLPGFPVSTIGWAQNAPSVGDVTGDGNMEIVQTTRGTTGGGRLHVFDSEGNELDGFPVNLDDGNLSHPSLHDLNGDGTLEIIVGQRDWPVGHLHIINHDGTAWNGNWPFELDHVPTGTAAVGDVTNNGELEIFYLSFDSAYLLNLDGEPLPGWPLQIEDAAFSFQSAALADLNDDGNLEIVVGAHQDNAGTYVFHADGTLMSGWPQLAGTWTFCPPTVTDLTGDGNLNILSGRAGSFAGPNPGFWAWETDGEVLPGFPYTVSPSGGSEGPLTVADINGSGTKEIFADSNVMEDGEGFLFGVDSEGNDLPGFPLRPQGFTHLNGAMIGDITDDGTYELAVISRLDTTAYVNVYDLPDEYVTQGDEWPTYHRRNTRGGLFDVIESIVGDLTGDGTVGGADLGILLSEWGPCDDCDDCPADLTGNCSVGGADLGVLLSNWTN